ncbi:MAG: FG-GAP repeat domain-containing protein [Sphingobacteriaceae bacterium]
MANKKRLFNGKIWSLAVVVLIVAACSLQKRAVGVHVDLKFQKQILSTEYISEGVAVGDVNKDGKMDVLAGTFWFEAPSWKRHEITTPYIHPSIGGYGTSFLNFSMDVNQDGWVDLIKVGYPSKESFWYENPKNQFGHWKERLLYSSVGNESPTMVDVDGDGRLDLLCNDPINKKVIWIKAPTAKNDTAWTAYTISSDTLRGINLFTHGLGFGDINLDGRKDVLIRDGWWEAPIDRMQTDWVFHAANLGDECAQMYVMDVDGDGDQDVISSSAHNYGIWWHEQGKDNLGNTSWKPHAIFNAFSQSHGLALTDINKDGNPDLITGKRFWAHNGGDPGAKEPPVLYWFEYKPGKQPKWIPHLIDSASGAGLQVVVSEMNNDKFPDIVIANKSGIYVFNQLKRK